MPKNAELDLMRKSAKHIAAAILCVGSLFAAGCGGGYGGGGTTTLTPAPVPAWTWVGGGSGANLGAIYGTEGVAATTNIPGARFPGADWTDSSGNVWMFGGEGLDVTSTLGFLNDMWEYNPSSKGWAWIGGSNSVNANGIYGTLGVAAPTNVPGARSGSVHWTDINHNFWLFGGQGYDSAGNISVGLNDLWEFNPSTKQWTWMSGSNVGGAVSVYGTLGIPDPANTPSGRFGSVGWTDATGNLWLFGGGGPAFNNDLWKFDTVLRQWTWEGGGNVGNRLGVYGTKGTPDAANIPGGREDMISWTDQQGNFWLFGAWGEDSNVDGVGIFNDLWEYSPTTNKWTWVSGSNTSGDTGVYGTQGVASAANVPGGRYGGVSWTDASGNLWLFGGFSQTNNATGTGLVFNDLWEFNVTTKEWTWVSGSNTPNATGVYGTLGVGRVGNTPGAREGGLTWTDSSGNLWLFGGGGFQGPTNYNDLWRWGLVQP